MDGEMRFQIRPACKLEKYPNHLGIMFFYFETKLWDVFECPIDRICAGTPLTGPTRAKSSLTKSQIFTLSTWVRLAAPRTLRASPHIGFPGIFSPTILQNHQNCWKRFFKKYFVVRNAQDTLARAQGNRTVLKPSKSLIFTMGRSERSICLIFKDFDGKLSIWENLGGFEHRCRFQNDFSHSKCVWASLRKCADTYEYSFFFSTSIFFLNVENDPWFF